MGLIERLSAKDLKCPVCGSGSIQYDAERGEYFCGVCGYVIMYEDVFWLYEKRGKGYRLAYSIDRVEYVRKTENLAGRFASQTLEEKRRRMQRMDKEVKFSSFLMTVYNVVEIFAEQMGLRKNDRHMIKMLARKVVGRGYKPKDIDVFVLALMLYYLKRYKRMYVYKSELEELIGRSKIHKLYNVLKRVEVVLENKSVVLSCEDVWYDVSRMLDISMKAYELGMKILKRISKNNRLMGRSKTGIVSAILYIVSQYYSLGYSQRMIAEMLGITEVTIRNTYKEILKELGYNSLKEFMEAKNFITEGKD